ncbi:MAG: FAD-dependent monooxygenase [Deltaproteobacteria bacterium]|nr:FAD-dependent monooxygenase [Deltaproteobacteria bacterium]
MKIVRPPVTTIARPEPVIATTPATTTTTTTTATVCAAPPGAVRAAVIERATVVGGGPTGLAQAALLMRRAKQIGLKELTIVELRGSYTRPVALGLRQINFDALKWLNPAACAELQRRANLEPRDDHKGFLDAVHFSERAGAFVMSNKPAGLVPDGARYASKLDDKTTSVADLAHEMMSTPTIGVVTMKELEDIFWRGLTTLAASSGVKLTVKREHEATLSKDAAGDVSVSLVSNAAGALSSSSSETLPAQDLVVVAQGGNSAARRQLGVDQSKPMSPTDWYISGALTDTAKPGTVANSVYKEAVVVDPATGRSQTQRLIRTTTPNGNHWMLLQVPDHVRFCSSITDVAAADLTRLRASLALKSGKPVADVDVIKARKQEEIDGYWRKLHEQTGPTTQPAFFGPFLFPLQARMFDTAALGNNAIAMGDSVGTSHFNVSAGAATGFTIHTLALDRYLSALSTGGSRGAALQVLDVELRQATMTWQLFGITQFEGDPRTLARSFFPKSVLDAILPPHIVERYWPKDGGVVDEALNPAWHKWLHKNDATALPPTAIPALRAHAQNDDVKRVQSEPRLSA